MLTPERRRHGPEDAGREEPFDLEPVRATPATRAGPAPPGTIAYHLVDDVAEGYLDAARRPERRDRRARGRDRDWPREQTRRRLAELRRDVLTIRRTLAPTRDAIRRVVDGRVDVGENASSTAARAHFADAYDRLLRAAESLDIARDLIADARDYHQAKIAQEQNEVVKKLAVVASLLLLPTFIVGVYGQNFEHMPELGWRLGYAFSWA